MGANERRLVSSHCRAMDILSRMRAKARGPQVHHLSVTLVVLVDQGGLQRLRITRSVVATA